MDICTKVTLRQRLLKSGKITLYFDYYPPIRNPKTSRMQRHEYLGIYLYANPTNQVQRDFNRPMLEKGELIVVVVRNLSLTVSSVSSTTANSKLIF